MEWKLAPNILENASCGRVVKAEKGRRRQGERGRGREERRREKRKVRNPQG